MAKANMRPAVAERITITKSESGTVPVKPSCFPGSSALVHGVAQGQSSVDVTVPRVSETLGSEGFESTAGRELAPVCQVGLHWA